ncbi:TPA: hypothetical protein ACGSHR_002907 [Escherichia coli]|uniref:hypothetical protein n=1 Tax=Escherichia coli TaxID=562 RepID=UPI002FE0F5E4
MAAQLSREELRTLALKKVESLKFTITQSAFTNIRRELEGELQLAEFALAGMDSEPVAYNQVQRDIMKAIIIRELSGNLRGDKLVMADIHAVTMALTEAGFRATPPAPVAVPDEWRSVLQEMVNAMLAYEMDVGEPAPYKHRKMMMRAGNLLASHHAAMLQGGKS